MSNEKLTSEQSLSLIAEMIGEAKHNLAVHGSFYFLLWGWVVMLANLGHYVLGKYALYEYPFIVWLLVIPAKIITIWYGIKKRKQRKASTHLGSVYARMWIAISVIIFILLIFMGKLNYNHNAVILLVTGLGTFISGTILKFKPIVIGGMILLVASIVCFSIPVIDQYLVAGIAIIFGYLVPGYLLRKEEIERV